MRTCANCGNRLAEGALFCRACGARHQPETSAATARRPSPPSGKPPRGGRRVALAALAILVLGAGAAAAIVLGDDDASSSTTVVVDGTDGRGRAVESVSGGRYVQAASFKTFPHAEAERERLAGLGIDVYTLSSDAAQELYPGFQVLVGGPFSDPTEARALLDQLHANGTRDAFVRKLTPALSSGGPGAIAGSWYGSVERVSGERPQLNDTFPTLLTIDPDGRYGSLYFSIAECEVKLTLTMETDAVLGYSQDPSCIGNGLWRIRRGEEGLMLSLLPAGSDVLVLGTLLPD